MQIDLAKAQFDTSNAERIIQSSIFYLELITSGTDPLFPAFHSINLLFKSEKVMARLSTDLESLASSGCRLSINLAEGLNLSKLSLSSCFIAAYFAASSTHPTFEGGKSYLGYIDITFNYETFELFLFVVKYLVRTK